MGSFKNVKIRTKLVGLVSVLSFFTLLVAGYGIYQAKSIDASYREIYEKDTSATAVAGQAGMYFNESRAVFLRAIMQQVPQERQESLDRMKALDDETDKYLVTLESKAVSAEGKNAMKQLQEQVAKYRSLRVNVLQLSQNGAVDWPSFTAAQQQAKAISGQVEKITGMAATAGETHMAQEGSDIAHNILLMAVVSLLIILLAMGMGTAMARKIARRIKVLGGAVERVAAGDLSEPVRVTAEDELGLVGESFERMRQSVHTAMGEIHVAADQVAAGAKNVSDASISLSQGAAEQASSVEELSSSIAEISSQTKSNADHAVQANAITGKAREHAEEGDTDMRSMLQAMEDINASSTNISKIIKVIDEIAFQTNILALNAAVEAARAGQHGKGFAVVAEEVRNLAARSAKAAKETTDMIESSIAKVNDGREIAHKTAEALQTIVTSVAEVANLVGNIAKASQEQSLALEQINQGVLQVSQVVQANSATAEESASASEELSAQADLLRVTANKFKLSNTAFSAVPPTAPAAPPAPPAPPVASRLQPVKPTRIALTEEEGFGKY